MDALILKLKRTWGWTFRALTIAGLTFAGYHLFSPDISVADTPLSQMTLKDIFGRICSVAVGLGGLAWFFSFPEQLPEDHPYVDKDCLGGRDPYLIWGKVGGWLIGLTVFAICFLRYLRVL
jgi:hypothetical protein